VMGRLIAINGRPVDEVDRPGSVERVSGWEHRLSTRLRRWGVPRLSPRLAEAWRTVKVRLLLARPAHKASGREDRSS
jgi:hypothetical protein